MDVAVDEDEWATTPPLQRDAVKRALPRLRREPHAVGDRIPRDRWPKRFQHYANLYRLPLPESWRAIYTVRVRKDVPPGVRIIFIGDHRRYDRLFGY